MASNYSFYSIPVYWFLALAPHGYSVSIITKANNNVWNNANSRSPGWVASLQKTVPAETLATFERAEAAHKNALENAPLFIGAVLAGNMAGLSASTMNLSLGAYLGLRVLYTVLYVNTTRNKTASLRSLVWAVQTLILFGVYITAGNKMMAKF
ncbi:hypothetical protein P153DRAFT_355018 [Dothidotthia symphoricarpi CBS 119687]|uniref:Membrane-associated proteins in eicosanoid and glutathione metabolism n=1 Tax=Dothidotthia symphoricarpi CBS 119687 TaxID=1392245 RepID=A0A6A6AKR4_9PLEO|nr:uncharacterized protein P153DRAFT_355018 [Dothidotthia symphoricarpi CBS 119687]KAF2132410.1 hypothetical protein P153DRAFT_355018 [Dothidotthia symphoricarpi CBS 119687]